MSGTSTRAWVSVLLCLVRAPDDEALLVLSSS